MTTEFKSLGCPDVTRHFFTEKGNFTLPIHLITEYPGACAQGIALLVGTAALCHFVGIAGTAATSITLFVALPFAVQSHLPNDSIQGTAQKIKVLVFALTGLAMAFVPLPISFWSFSMLRWSTITTISIILSQSIKNHVDDICRDELARQIIREASV